MNFLKYILVALAGALVAGLFHRSQERVPAMVEAVPPPRVQSEAVQRETGSAALAELEQARRENAELQTQLEKARASLAEGAATLAVTRERLEELRRPMTMDLMSSTLRADLKSGEVVVTGGYLLPDGRRLYAMTRPVIERTEDGEAVAVSGRILSLDEAAGKTVGLDNLNTNAANTLQHGEVWVADEELDVLAKLVGAPGVDLQTTPTLYVKPGASGVIELGDLKLKVTPVVTGGDNLDFEVRFEQPQAIAEE